MPVSTTPPDRHSLEGMGMRPLPQFLSFGLYSQEESIPHEMHRFDILARSDKEDRVISDAENASDEFFSLSSHEPRPERVDLGRNGAWEEISQ